MEKTAKYHSDEWKELVEQGWITMSVEADGVALMLYQKHECTCGRQAPPFTCPIHGEINPI